MVTAIDPQQAHAGDLVDVIGQGFTGDPSRDVVIFTNGVAVHPEVDGPGRLSVRVPANAVTGPVTAQAGEAVATGAPVLTILGRGLAGAYYHFDGPIERLPGTAGRPPDLVRVDPQILFGETYSFNLPFTPHHFEALWTGLLLAPADGNYEFQLGSDDGSRLTIDGQVVIDNDGLHGYTVVHGAAPLTAGPHQVRVEFFENEGYAAVRLYWKAPGRGWEIIPGQFLAPPD
jgi:hypothetical protein